MTVSSSDDVATGAGGGDGAAGAGVDEHRKALATVIARGTLSLEHLWMRTFAIGGDLDLLDIEGYLHELVSLTPFQRDVLAQAANEHVDDLAGRCRVPYSRTLRHPLSGHGPLAGLVRLLQEAPRAIAGELADVAAEAAAAIGVDVVVYLVDYEQRHLVPVPTRPEGLDAVTAREPLDVESTLPGRAFQSGVTQPATVDGQLRLWMPLVDGTERLGVLDVMLADARDLHDPDLRAECGWLARLVATLVVAAAEHGDAVDAVRRTRPKSPASELMSSLLPPLTAGTDRFTVAGLIEPAYEMGGDAFDYALGSDRVQVAVFDGMGHSMGAGLIVATALATYRAARRDGRDLEATAQAIDEAIDQHFEDSFATGVLADLDLTTGRLDYLVAGHAAPLLLRAGKVVASLGEGRRLPFGLGLGGGPGLGGGSGLGGVGSAAQAALEPGDWLVLHTDGITEARGEGGELFGEERLVDLLEREAMSQHPPPETVRRLVRAVLDHQGGVLQDDATVLLARWAPSATVVPGARPSAL